MKKNRKVTVNSVTINFRNYGEITIPKGVLVTNETAMGIDDKYNFVDEFDWIDTCLLYTSSLQTIWRTTGLFLPVVPNRLIWFL